MTRESIPVKRLFIPLLAMSANFHGTAKRGEKTSLAIASSFRKRYVIWRQTSFNLLTAKFSQKQISTKCHNFIFSNSEKQIAPCVSTGRELAFECSHHRISSPDSKGRVTLQNSIKHRLWQ